MGSINDEGLKKVISGCSPHSRFWPQRALYHIFSLARAA